jgi:hypothetical protein
VYLIVLIVNSLFLDRNPALKGLRPLETHRTV